MKDKFKNRWLMVGLVWAGVLALHFWTLEKMDQVRRMHAQRDVFLRDQQFWGQNAHHISNILQQYASLTPNVASLKLGLLHVENDLKHRALALGLAEVAFSPQSEMNAGGVMPIKLTFRGRLADAHRWMESLRKDLPSLWIRIVKIRLDPPAAAADFELALNYRYNVSSAEGDR